MMHTSPLDVPGTKDAGGMNVVVRAQAEALADAGNTVTIYTRRSDATVDARVQLRDRLEVVHLDAGPAELLAKGVHEDHMAEFGARLGEELAARPVDVLHAEHWFSGIAALDVARAAGIPLVQSYHSIAAPESTPLTEGERPESEGRLDGERRLAHEVDLVIAVSEAERETIVTRLGADPARVRVAPLGVDTELFRPCMRDECAEREDWLRRGGRPEVILVGRLHPLKSFDLVVDALALMSPEQRPALRIVGAPPPDGDEYARGLHESVAQHGLIGTTSFDGALRRGELAERIRRASLMLVPSYTETFGLVALEAAASGVPTIARDAGGLREAVIDGVTGALLDGDPELWAREIERLLGDRDLLGEMSRASRAHALERNWAVSAQSLFDVYREVVPA